MSIWEAIWQGIVQGLAEFLPISSSGHLSVMQHFFGITGSTALTVSAFLHLGTLAAVFIAFYKQLWGLVIELVCTVGDVFTGKFSFKKMSERRKFLFLLIVSCLPLLVVLPLKDQIEALAGDNDIIVEGVCFLFSGFMILLGSRLARPEGKGLTSANLGYGKALFIGAAQAVATLPGVSRSGSTISASLMAGADRSYAFDYAFILGTPAILAAAGLEFKDALTVGVSFDWLPMLIGMLVAGAVGYLALKLVGRIVRSGAFRYFGFYCLAVGVIVIGLGIYEAVSGNLISAMLR